MEKEAELHFEIENYKEDYDNYYPYRTMPEDINKIVREVNKKREEHKEEITLLPARKGKTPIMRKK